MKNDFTNIPSYTQFESRDLIKQYLNGNLDPVNDPLWRNSGADNPEEYANWAFNMCGMACLKMILKHALNKEFKTVELAKQALSYNAYIPTEDPREIDGLIYHPFKVYLEKEFAFKVLIAKFLTITMIWLALKLHFYTIVSVSPQIRNHPTNDFKKGGHLILIKSLSLKKQQVVFNNPSGTSPSTQENCTMKLKDFKKYFANRGILIKF